MAKLTKTKEELDDIYENIFEENEETKKEKEDFSKEELQEAVKVIKSTYDDSKDYLKDEDYVQLNIKPKTFENENPQRERLIKKIQKSYSSEPTLSPRHRIEREGLPSLPNPIKIEKKIEKKQFDFDILFKFAVLIILSILLIMVGAGKLKSDVNTDISLNNSNPIINVNTNNSNPTSNTFNNNFNQTATYTTNVQINATIQLPKEVLNDLKKIANLTNSS